MPSLRPQLIYQHPGDDLAKLYAPTLVSGAIDPNYPLENLSNDNPALPAKFTSTSLRLVWDLTFAQLVALPIFLHWNVDVGATATWEVNTTNTWPGLAVTPIVTNDLNGAGYRPYSWLDQSAALGRRYASLAISGNAEPIIIGGIWLGATQRLLDSLIAWGVKTPIGQRKVVLETNMGVRHKFTRAPTGRIADGQMLCSQSERDAVKFWAEATGFGAQATPIVFDHRVNHARFMEWDLEEIEEQPVATDETAGDYQYMLPVSWRDVPPGEAWS